ncbi:MULTISPECIES: ArsR/SmtB family transcription factor [Curtobacterium]|uniref:ArsR/SmtB family transcription factor n=1 Tax=Curtobacterium TaxID=2034 RepID=UPI00217F1C00|nr:ArsR family transcriptional regulator [Curtobacterium flaccumfaciens]MCS6562922.1 ArsR family transcriptional regulator [Curtobacterium flaccumfaciens pv. poinsettiae]UXN29852.1 ArsR family transcriptional regulator [Curtobacterium flaccumfaciens]
MTGETPDVATSLAAINERLTALEALAAERLGDAGPASTFWVLDELRRAASPSVVYAGLVPTSDNRLTEWQVGSAVADLEALQWDALAPGMAALGHPLRLRILQLVHNGEDRVADLAAAPGVGTTGQIYHHVHLLADAGWLVPAGRSRYAIPAERIVPLLTLIAIVAPV